MRITVHVGDNHYETVLRCDLCRTLMLPGRKGPERRWCSKKCRQTAYYRRTRQVTRPWT